jgi:GMP synthase-like glutamine amidotransferase
VRVLFVEHDHTSPPGPVAAAFGRRGYEVDEVIIVPSDRFDTPDVDLALPDAADYDVIVPMGAPWSAVPGRDTGITSWLLPELDWLRAAHQADVPILGICFGGQLMARALGGELGKSSEAEIGWTSVDTDRPDLVAAGPWFEWHYDRFSPPPGATEIARNAVTSQAYVIGRTLGVQFHPELTAVGLQGWLDHGGAALARAHGLDPDELVAQTKALEPAAADRADALVDAFLTQVAGLPTAQ